jgi:hypothetical protein
MTFLSRLFGRSNTKTIEQIADEGIANVTRMTNEAIERVNKMASEAIEKINGDPSTAPAKTEPVASRYYTLEDAFNSGKTYLPGRAEDFVKVTYNFSADCDSKDGWNIAFNPWNVTTSDIPVFMPRSVIPSQQLETKRVMPWNTWQYTYVERKSADFFVSKENLAKASGSLESAIKKISGTVKLTQTYDGHRECCYAKVFVSAKSADDKRFDYDLIRSIGNTEITDENLPRLRNLYDELGKKEIAAHLDKRIAAIKANTRGKTILGNKYVLDSLKEMDNLSFAHPLLITKLKDIDTQASELAVSRDKELGTLTELYGSNLTQESLADKRKVIIGKYDPQIAELGEKKYELASSLRSVKEIIARLGASDIRTLPREDYMALNRAIRVSNKSNVGND